MHVPCDLGPAGSANACTNKPCATQADFSGLEYDVRCLIAGQTASSLQVREDLPASAALSTLDLTMVATPVPPITNLS